MSKPSEMPPKLASVDTAVTELERAREEAQRDFLDRYADTVEDVRALMDAFVEYDDQTAAALVQAVVMLMPEEDY